MGVEKTLVDFIVSAWETGRMVSKDDLIMDAETAEKNCREIAAGFEKGEEEKAKVLMDYADECKELVDYLKRI